MIRKREKKDCEAIAKVVTISWNETYKGIVPECFLEDLKINEKERAKMAYDKFDEQDNTQLVLEIDGKVVGFVNYGKTKDSEYPNYGEIFAIYIIKKYQGYGYGKKLIAEAMMELKKLGFNEVLIACLKENPSNNFYKKIGGKYIKERLYSKFNLLENVYYFKNF